MSSGAASAPSGPSCLAFGLREPFDDLKSAGREIDQIRKEDVEAGSKHLP